MSARSKQAIVASIIFSGGCFMYALYDKEIQLARLRQGAVQDRERQKLKKQNLQDLEKNILIEEQYKKARAEKDAKEKGAVS